MDRLSREFVEHLHGNCAVRTFAWWQKIYYVLIAAGLTALLIYRWDYWIFTVSTLLMLLYFTGGMQKILAALLAVFGGGLEKVEKAELEKIRDGELPVYTILLPLYREPEVAAKIVRNVLALEYPQGKLDVKLLLEDGDRETLTALQTAKLPGCFEIIVAPPGSPRTKPRACNYGLERAKGEFCVIYDAEDQPETDQLLKAVAVFRRRGMENVFCIQGKLNFYNRRQNLLTRLFTIEYSTNFDLHLPGLQKLGAPLPLGGTSNHFRTAELRKMHGWDPFNVTEDCDLGLRIARHHGRTLVLDSTTYEEANPAIGNFIRQRSRWVKGFLQTHLVHARSPLGLLRSLGFYGTWNAYLTVGGSVMMMLTNLICWPLLLLYAGLLLNGWRHGYSLMQQIVYQAGAAPMTAAHAWPLIYAGPEENWLFSGLSFGFAGMSALLLIGNFVLVAVGMAAVLKRRYWELLPATLLLPFYWVLISAAAWKGAWQLLTKPFYWEKTRHGLDRKK